MEEIAMRKVNDYSGEFLPNLEFTDFSHETIADLLTLYARLYMALDGFWYLTVKERVGNEEALACDIQAWDKHAKYEMTRISKQLNIRGNDVISVMKSIQLTPWLQQTRFTIEVKDHNKAKLTVNHCPTLVALEKEGEGRENEICNIVDRKLFQVYSSFFNPNIKVECLKIAPRKNKDEICCQWEFDLEK
jgi:hypothetical protein